MKTTDLCDANPEKVQVLSPMKWKHFGGTKMFHGKIHTIKCYEDNSFVRKALEENGEGKVLVVDGGGSMRCALLGDMLGELAVKNKWNGILIYGCIRDSVAMPTLAVGVIALDTIPLKSQKKNTGEVNIPVKFGGVEFFPDNYIYCDEDGVITAASELHL